MRPMPELEIINVPVDELVPYAQNAKLHPHEQVDQIAESIRRFGNCDPIAVWHNDEGEMEIVEGHGRVMALKALGIAEAPAIFLDHLSDQQRRAYALIHNKLTMSSGFDYEMLMQELSEIADVELETYGFDLESEMVDVDSLFDEEKPENETKKDKFITVTCPHCGHDNELPT